MLKEKTGSKETEVDMDDITDTEDFVPEIEIEDIRMSLSGSLNEMGVSPMKLHSLPSHSKVSYGKRKLQQVHRKLKEKESDIQCKVVKLMNISADDLSTSVDASGSFTE